jgi:CheY-like chemotaxis protein
VLADPGQLLQVLLNLLVNASEAIGDQPGKITLAAGNSTFAGAWQDVLGKEQPAGKYVHLSVADSGSGMDEKYTRAAFEPLNSSKSLGRGLGLAAVAGIISQHQGAIRVDSHPGQGSTFAVYLPWATCAPLPAKPAKRLAERGHETILAVDDDETVLKVLQAMLKRAGYSVLAASTSRQGAALFCANPDAVALALLDVHLAQESGHELLAQLRSLRPGLPVIISSGFSEELTLAQTYQDGRTAFMQKPYDTATLTRNVREMLDRCAVASTRRGL